MSTRRTSSPSSTPRTAASSTRRRCRTSATSCTTTAGTAAARRATARPFHLVMPGFRSSRIHVVNVADDPRAAIEKVIEPEEVVAWTGYTRPHTSTACRGQRRRLHARRRRRECRGRLRVPRREDVRAEGPLGERRRATAFNYDFWYQPRKNALVSSEFAEPNAYEPGFDLEDVASGGTGAGSTSGTSPSGRSSRRSTSGSRGSSRSRSGGCTILTPSRASSPRRSRASSGGSTARTAPGRPIRSSRPRRSS